jgi:hypothetical protein
MKTNQTDRRPVICIADAEERTGGGHYISHFCQYTRLLIQSGARVVALCPYPEAVRTLLGAEALHGNDALFILKTTPHPEIRTPAKKGFRKLRRRTGLIRRWRRLSDAITAAERHCGLTVDHVFVTDLPSFSIFYRHSLTGPIDRAFRRPWSAWSYDSSFFSRSGGAGEAQILKKNLPGCFFSKHLHRIFHIDEALVLEVNRLTGSGKFRYVPDVTDTALPSTMPELAAQIKARAGSRKIIILPGVQGKRKGLYTALQLAAQRPDLFFAFAGPLDRADHPPGGIEQLRQFMNTPPENCFFHLHRIDREEELNALICAAHAVWAVYPNHPHASGILLKAALFSKPVLIADNAPLMCDLAKRYRIATPVPPGNLSACSAALDCALAAPAPAKPDRIQHDYSPGKLQGIIQEFVSGLRHTEG